MRKLCKALGVFLFATVLMVSLSAMSEAKISVTIKNNRSHSMSLAFYWRGFDTPDDRRQGWYNVKPGESRTITFNDAIYMMTGESFGYYATGDKLVWKGDFVYAIIDPSKAFKGHPDDPIEGGKKVGFRKVNIKKINDDDGKATLTFNP